nr:MAG: ORF1 [Torque teno midi virus]
MPFWWRRRRRTWYPTRWYRRYTNKTRRRKRRPYRKRRHRFSNRRRRRRKRTRKVRRKKQKIPIFQWQPDSIRKCKIKGIGCICAGAEGTQMYCYTNEKELFPQPKAPGGGGFGCETFSLQYLYEQWVAHKNVWTASNDYKDLVRFTGSKFTFFRHATTDFVIRYHRQPPFDIQKTTYTDIHPVNLLLAKHHKVILSRKSHPYGKNSVTVRIKPPKQMLTKWFFQKEFTKYDLLRIDAAAANMEWAMYGPNTTNSNLTLYCLGTKFYANTSWQKNTDDHPYLPYPSYPITKEVSFEYPTRTGKNTIKIKPKNYLESVNYNLGFFDWRVLQATKVFTDLQTYHERPMTVCRYNPDIDTGEKNVVYVVSITSNGKWVVPQDKDLYVVEKPLWMAIYGLWNYILIKKSPAHDFFKYHLFVLKSPAIELITATVQTEFPPIDLEFATGNLPYGETITDTQKSLWYPTAYMQLNTLTAICKCGPYIPKYKNLPNSSWNLMYRYTFYFKWGGPSIEDQPVQNPENQNKYPVPDTLTKTIQISNPLKQHCKAMFRAWDSRRGLLTKAAIKRMSEHLQSDSSVYSDETEAPKKKKKRTAQIKNPEEEDQEIHSCIQSLCQEVPQETPQTTEDIKQLIILQQQQQQQLKLNLIKLLTDLKMKQRMLQLHTGLN